MYLSRDERTGEIRIVGEKVVYLTRMSFNEFVFLAFWAKKRWLGKFWNYIRDQKLITGKRERNVRK